MFGWFSPKCPVDTREKTWTETRMRWLADQFGIDRLLQAEVVLPTEEFFPDPYEGDVEGVQRILERLCGYMAIDARKVRLDICLDAQLPGAAGQYDRGQQTVIRVAESLLADPLRLTATLAHELAHEMLLGGGVLTTDVADHEWITDLLPVFLGVGVFAANATINEAHGHVGNWSWWSVGKSGYLTARIFGYAFALFAFMRGEENPPWASHLRLDASSAVRDGLKYLRKTNDSLFHPDTIRVKRVPLSAGELLTRLEAESPSVRLAALWEIGERKVIDPGVVAAVSQALTDDDPGVSEMAGRTLAVLGPSAKGTVPLLVEALSAGCADTRAGAACALGALREQPELVIPELCVLVRDKNRTVVAEAARALSQFGAQAQPCAPRLVDAFRIALIECDSLVEVLAGTLLAITPDPEQCVDEHLPDWDPELRQFALTALQEQHSSASHKGVAADRVNRCMLVRFVVS